MMGRVVGMRWWLLCVENSGLLRSEVILERKWDFAPKLCVLASVGKRWKMMLVFCKILAQKYWY